MPASRKGNRFYAVRLPDEVAELLEKEAGPTLRGRASGAPLLIRRLVYEHFGLEMPPQHAQHESPRRQRKRTTAETPARRPRRTTAKG